MVGLYEPRTVSFDVVLCTFKESSVHVTGGLVWMTFFVIVSRFSFTGSSSQSLTISLGDRFFEIGVSSEKVLCDFNN